MLQSEAPGYDHPRASLGIRTAVANDADDHAANLTGWTQSYDQLAAGRFHGTVRELWLGRTMQLFEETTSHAIRQSCTVWQGAYWFGIPISRDISGKIGDRNIESNHIALRPGGSAFELLTPSSFSIVGLVVDRQALLDYAEATQQRDLSEHLLEQELLDVGEHATSALLSKLRQVFAGPDFRHTYQTQQALQDDLLGALTACCLRRPDQTADIRITSRDRHRLVNRVREYALAHQDDPLSIPHLCRVFRVSRRTLQYAFQDVGGISPGAYLRIVRLNGVRRTLRGPREAFVDVQDVAARWGFWHASQFGRDYKKHFGELPSETLRRRAS